MTALFVVIFLGQWLKEPTHASSLVGVGLSLAALLVFGPDSFIIPAMVAILVACLALRQRLEPVVGLAGEEGASAAPSGPAGEDDSAAREADAR